MFKVNIYLKHEAHILAGYLITSAKPWKTKAEEVSLVTSRKVLKSPELFDRMFNSVVQEK